MQSLETLNPGPATRLRHFFVLGQSGSDAIT